VTRLDTSRVRGSGRSSVTWAHAGSSSKSDFELALDAAQIVSYYKGVPLELDADANASAGRGAHGRRPALPGVRRVAHEQLHRDVGPHVQGFLLDVRRFTSILPKRASRIASYMMHVAWNTGRGVTLL